MGIYTKETEMFSPNEAFEDAIREGLLVPDKDAENSAYKFMYMFSKRGNPTVFESGTKGFHYHHYFKHYHTREYVNTK
ncbi:hypothetical protein LCGC14_1184120 [marine sediment metagenome]|uniref:Uncharacterized protein n=1 Tax=marine sediment metagenome TaxID=412755 RepID=A0A0F9PRS6_9ZZZZ|nr:hypothetical protein [Candidatus Aminicenantes bacterium]